MGLIVFVEHGRFWIAAHARGAHFVDRQPRRSDFLEHVNVLGARGGEHFRGLNGDVPGHGALVFAPVTVNFQRGNTPGIELVLVDFDIVAVIWQAFAKTTHSHAPGAGHLQNVLEFRAEAGHPHAAGPAVAAAAALIAVAAKEVFVFGFDVAETRDVDAVGAVAEVDPVGRGVDLPVRPAAHDVVHHVLPQLSARVREPRVEQDARRLERRGAQEDDAALELEGVLRLTVDDADARGLSRLRIVDEIEDEAVNDTVRTNGEAAGFLRGGKR